MPRIRAELVAFVAFVVSLLAPRDVAVGRFRLAGRMSRADRRERLTSGLLCAAFLLKGVLWSVAFPLWQGPDEDDHYAVIQFIGELGRLPDVGDEILPDDIVLSRALADVGRLDYNPEQRQLFSNSAEGPNEAALNQLPPELKRSFDSGVQAKLTHATPLYYVLATPLYRLTADEPLLVRAFAQRWLSTVLTTPLIVIAWGIGRRLWPGDSAADRANRITLPFLVAFQPMITEISAVVTVDGLFFVVYGALIWLCLRVIQDGLTRRRALALGALFAIGLLIKPTINGIAPVIAAIGLYELWRRRDAWRRVVIDGALMVVTILVPVGWWMRRSWRINDDLFYMNPIEKGHRIIENPVFDYTVLTHAVDYWRSVWGGIFVTWWAHFGWIDTPLPSWTYHVLRCLTVVALLGVIRLAWRHRRSGFSREMWLSWLALALTILIPIALLQLYDYTWWRTYGMGRGLQGRYWLGTAIPMLAFWLVGLLAWLPARWRPAGHVALRLGMIGLNVVSLLTAIVPRYYL